MSGCKFSVLMAFYHGDSPAALRQALTSLLVQTQPATEVVLVQDGEVSDELLSVVDEFASLPLVRVVLASNLGLAAALNAGLAHCRFDWVARMDSDDIAMPERFASQVEYLSEHPEVDVLGGQIVEFKGKADNVVAQRLVPIEHGDILQFLRHRNPMNHMTVMFRRAKVIEQGGYVTLPWMEDYLLWARLASSASVFANLSSVLVSVRVDSLMQRRRGWLLLKSEWNLQCWLYRLKLVSQPTAWFNFLLRATSRLLPSLVLHFLYQRFLRQRSSRN